MKNEMHNPAPTPVARIYVSSILAMTALFFFGVGVPCWFAFNLAWGAGMGGMCAVWGGPGFGVMAAGARLSAIEERLALQDVPNVKTAYENTGNAFTIAPNIARSV